MPRQLTRSSAHTHRDPPIPDTAGRQPLLIRRRNKKTLRWSATCCTPPLLFFSDDGSMKRKDQYSNSCCPHLVCDGTKAVRTPPKAMAPLRRSHQITVPTLKWWHSQPGLHFHQCVFLSTFSPDKIYSLRFQIIRHSKNLGESKQSQIWPRL